MASPFAQFDSLRTLLAPRAPGDHGVRPGVVLGITLLLSFLLGPAIVERLRWSKVSHGLLVRDVRVAESPDDARQCRSDTCSFEAAAPVPEALKTEAHLACERKGDLWVKAGKSGASTCVKRTKDSGKRCTTGKQCKGECLARSGTCAPYQPLFGCNEVLQDNGMRTTLCLD